MDLVDETFATHIRFYISQHDSSAKFIQSYCEVWMSRMISLQYEGFANATQLL